MRFIFFGGKDIGCFILRSLILEGHIPAGIVVYKDIISEDELELANGHGVQILRINKFKQQQDQLKDFIKAIMADSFISVAFPFILSKDILDLVKYPINIHTGAIPKYRGHHPISAALLNDENFQGTTVHYMAEEVDAGEILLQDYVFIENTDDINSIKKKLISLSFKLITTVINQLNCNTLYPKKQLGEVIWAPKRTPEDSKIDFNKPSRYLHNFIRALVDPYPNAFGYVNGKLVKFKASCLNNNAGVVIDKTINNKYVISTNDGIVMVETDAVLQIGDVIN